MLPLGIYLAGCALELGVGPKAAQRIEWIAIGLSNAHVNPEATVGAHLSPSTH
jgi:glycerol uptake facilitator-like aquaporin